MTEPVARMLCCVSSNTDSAQVRRDSCEQEVLGKQFSMGDEATTASKKLLFPPCYRSTEELLHFQRCQLADPSEQGSELQSQ